MELFSLVGKIALDGMDKVNSDMDTATNKADKTSKKFDEAGGKSESFASKFGKGVKTAVGVGTAIVGTATSVAVGLTEFAKKSASVADNVDKMSQKIDISREAYQELDFICSQSGTSVDIFQAGLKSMRTVMDTTIKGTSKTATALEELGISAVDSQGNMRSSEEVMWEALETLQNMEDQTKKATLASKLFGRSGTELMPLLNGASGSIAEMKNQAHDLGLVLSDEVIDNGVKMTDSLDQTQRAFQAIATNLGGVLMPIITKVSEYIQSKLPQITSFIQRLEPIFSGLLDGMLPPLMNLAEQVLPMLFDIIGQLLPAFSSIISQILPVITSLLQLLLPVIGEIVQKILPILMTALNGLMPIFDPLLSIIEVVLNVVMMILDPLLDLVNTILPPIISLINAVVNLLAPIFKVLEPIFSIIMMLIEPLLQMVGFILQPLIGLITLIINLITPIFKILEPIFTIFQKLLEPFREMVGKLLAPFAQMWEKIQEAFAPLEGVLDPLYDMFEDLEEPLTDLLETILPPMIKIVDQMAVMLSDNLGVAVDWLAGVIKTFATDAQTNVKGLVEKIKTAISTTINFIKNFKTNATNIFNNIKTTVTTVFTNVKNAIVNPIKTAFETVKGVIDKIKNTFTEKFTAVQNFMKGVFDKIKGFFNFKVELPKVKLPHFKITPSGWQIGDLLKGTIPQLGIEWYAKAMNNPMIMDKPTAFGVNSAGQVMAGGERGSEVVSGTETLMNMISTAMASQNERMEELLANMLGIMAEYMPQMANTQLVMETGAVVGQLAPAMDTALGRLAIRKGRGV